jgi:hypothetical protein
MNKQPVDGPTTAAQWLEIFNTAWLAIPLEIRHAIIDGDGDSPGAGHYLTRAIERVTQERDALRLEVARTYAMWTGRDGMSLPLSDAVGEVVSELQGRLDSKQAHIDALMLEYCPEDMTPEQVETWGNHQRAVEGSKP